MLTQKQEDFKNDLFAGIPQRDAYMNHYNTQNMLSATIDRAAYELAKNPKIASSLEELRQGVKSDLIADVGERKEKLTEVLRDKHKVPLTAREKVYAIAELNKMSGDYAPERLEVEAIKTFIFVLPDGTRVTPKQLYGGTDGQEGTGTVKEAETA